MNGKGRYIIGLSFPGQVLRVFEWCGQSGEKKTIRGAFRPERIPQYVSQEESGTFKKQSR